jgi:hypothetical protein
MVTKLIIYNMNLYIIITEVYKPVKSNSSFGNYAVAVDFKYTTGGYANTYKYALRKSEAQCIYDRLTLFKDLKRELSIYDL